MCGRFIRGWDSIGDIDKNRLFGSFQEDAFQSHQHKTVSQSTGYAGSHHHSVRYNSYKEAGNWGSSCCIWELSDQSSKTHENATLSSGSHSHIIPELRTNEIVSINDTMVRFSDETRPNNIALLFCIKYK